MNGKQTAMMAVVSMALLATMMTISSPTQALAHGHWNPDGDFTLQSESELDSEEEMQIRPLSADSSFSAKSAIAPSNTEEEEQQPVAFEKIQMMPIPQQQQQLQQPTLQQEPTMVLNPEICDDDLDNDFDGKVDGRDEECSYIAGSSTSSFPSPGQEQSVIDEMTEREDEDAEQQSDEDLNEDSGGNENNDDEGDREDNDSNDHEEDEDEDTEQQSDGEDNNNDNDDDDDDDE